MITKIHYAGNFNTDTILIQMVHDESVATLDEEVEQIRALAKTESFLLVALQVENWNDDLTPWPAPAVFGKDGFGGAAAQTLNQLETEIVPAILKEWKAKKTIAGDVAKPLTSKPADTFTEIGEAAEDAPSSPAAKLVLGGYSLGGLFALWATTRCSMFEGVAAASPSVWYPGFVEYMRESLGKRPKRVVEQEAYPEGNRLMTERVYLSLGDKEEKTKNPVMRQVGNCIRDIGQLFEERGICYCLEWNEGNHFRDPMLRMAKGFAWTIDAGESCPKG